MLTLRSLDLYDAALVVVVAAIVACNAAIPFW
jgi:hypothetical protein